MKTTTILLITAMLTGLIFSQPPGGKGGKRQGGGGGRMLNNIDRLAQILELDADQKEKFIEITSEFRTTQEKFKINVQRSNLDIEEAMLEEKPDLKEIKKLIDQKMSYLGQMEFSRVQRDVALKEILDDNQKMKFDNLMQKAHHGQGKHRGGGGKPQQQRRPGQHPNSQGGRGAGQQR